MSKLDGEGSIARSVTVRDRDSRADGAQKLQLSEPLFALHRDLDRLKPGPIPLADAVRTCLAAVSRRYAQREDAIDCTTNDPQARFSRVTDHPRISEVLAAIFEADDVQPLLHLMEPERPAVLDTTESGVTLSLGLGTDSPRL